MAVDWQKIGTALGGMGAGFQGRGLEWMRGYQQDQAMRAQQEQQLSEERRRAAALDLYGLSTLLGQGRTDAAMALMNNREREIMELGGESIMTSYLRDLMQAGEFDEAKAFADMALQQAQAAGYIQMPERRTISGSDIVGGNVVQQNPDGTFTVQQVLSPEQMQAGQEQFEVLTPEEVAALGLNPEQAYKRNRQTQEVSQIGSSGTVVNVNTGDMLSPGQRKVDESFAQEYVDWISGGGADQIGNLASLKTVLGQLERGEQLTGPSIGLFPDFINAIKNPNALDAKQRVEEVVQRNLRQVLGAQFTQQEGDRLISRAYDPRLPPEQNASRLRRLIAQMETAAAQRDAMARYFEEHGTLRGYRGPRPHINDFFSAISGVEVGQVVDGYRYKGGDPGDENSWERVQ